MARNRENIVYHNIRMNLDNEQHCRVHKVLMNLNTNVHKSVNQFLIDAADADTARAIYAASNGEKAQALAMYLGFEKAIVATKDTPVMAGAWDPRRHPPAG